MNEYMIERSASRDITPIFSGYQECRPGHSFGPYVRNYYLIHFCLKGNGKLFDKFGIHRVNAGEMFIIRPGEITTYSADSEEPWVYSWIAFEGDMASLFDTDRSVYSFPLELGLEIQRLTKDGESSPYVFISLIYKLMYSVFGSERKRDDVVERVKQYISFNYMRELSVSEISEYFGYERSYLYRVFKQCCGISIKEYIVKTRMQASHILLSKGFSVKSTAFAVGYADQFNFSKAFKKHFGIAPKSEKKSKRHLEK